MNDRLEIIVTQGCIDTGEYRSSERCAVAVALWAAGHRDVSVSLVSVWADGIGYRLTGELQAWIVDFDLERPVYPERFVLEPERKPVPAPMELVAA